MLTSIAPKSELNRPITISEIDELSKTDKAERNNALQDRISTVESDIKDIKSQIQELSNSKVGYTSWGALGLAVITTFGALFFNMDIHSKISDLSGKMGEFKNFKESTNNSIGDMKGDIRDIRNLLIERRVREIATNPKETVEALKQSLTKASYNKLEMGIAAQLAQIVIAQKISIDSKEIRRETANLSTIVQLEKDHWENLLEILNLLSYSDDREWQAITSKLTLRSPVLSDKCINPGTLYLTKGVPMNFQVFPREFGFVPAKDAALLWKKDVPCDRDENAKNYPLYAVIEGSSSVKIKLQGFKAKNIVFRNITVEFGDGLPILENVRFINCKFVFEKNKTTEKVMKQIFSTNIVNLL